MLRTYLPAIVFLGLGGLVGALFVTAGSFLGPKPKTPTTYQADPYESGMPSEVHQGFRFGISFYLIAMLFILFDIEVVFLYPWAVNFTQMLKSHGSTIFWSMAGFLSLVTVGYVYAIRKGVLDWKKG